MAGADLLTRGNALLGIGYAYTRGNVTENTDNGTMTENGGFLYGQLPVGRFMVSGIGSYGVSWTDTQRVNPLGGALLQDNNVGGANALVSVNVSLPIALRDVTLAPYGRVTGSVCRRPRPRRRRFCRGAQHASYAGNDVRGMIGLTVGSPVSSPLAAEATYKLDLGVGADAGNLLNPELNATLAGFAMPIAAPQTSTVFAQASITGTLRLAKTSYLYGQLSGAVRGNETLPASRAASASASTHRLNGKARATARAFFCRSVYAGRGRGDSQDRSRRGGLKPPEVVDAVSR